MRCLVLNLVSERCTQATLYYEVSKLSVLAPVMTSCPWEPHDQALFEKRITFPTSILPPPPHRKTGGLNDHTRATEKHMIETLLNDIDISN